MRIISTKEAEKIILNQTEDFGIEEIDFSNSSGRILKENIVADRDFPPFDRVSMDGIAINFESFLKGQREFHIEGVQPAGSPQITLKNSANCVEAMTGSILPKNADTIIRYEDVFIENGIAKINVEKLIKFQNIHKKGLDRKKNDILIVENTITSPAEMGVLATVGKSKVKVAKQPKIAIISTGNELVEISEAPENYQIRKSNVFTLDSLIERLKIKSHLVHICDNKQLLKQKIDILLQDFDVLIFSGAVSKGKYDFIPEVLDELGVEKLFHKVKQRPGKPFWFGKKGQKTVFAFPGNPVSTFVSCLKYFHPWYFKSMGVENLCSSTAILSENFNFNKEITYFLQVKLTKYNGKLYATPETGKGSGDLANLVNADAFLELPENISNFSKGEVYKVFSYR